MKISAKIPKFQSVMLFSGTVPVLDKKDAFCLHTSVVSSLRSVYF